MQKKLDILRQWIKSERKARGFTLVRLAELTNLTQANLSRIERGDTQLSLFTLIRILRVFRLSYMSLVTHDIIDGPDIAWIKRKIQNAKPEFPTLTPGDIDNFVTPRLSVKPVLEKWTQSFIRRQLGFSEQAARELIPDAYGVMLLAQPDSTTLPQIGKVIYPPEMPIDLVRNNYYAGGAMLLFDLAAYIKQSRWQKGMSRHQLANAIGRTHTGVRQLETNISTRTLFIDILNLDAALGAKGELLAIAWRVGELYLGIYGMDASAIDLTPYRHDQISWFTRILVLLRLFQYHNMGQEAQGYINEMRSRTVLHSHPRSESTKKWIDTFGISPSNNRPLTLPTFSDSQNIARARNDFLQFVFEQAYSELHTSPRPDEAKMDLMADLGEIEREIQKGDQIRLSFLRRRLVAFKSMAPDVAQGLLSNLASPDAPVDDDVRKVAQKVTGK